MVRETSVRILDRWYHLLFPGDIERIRANLQRWAWAISDKLARQKGEPEAFIPCFGFVDGTARRTARPAGADFMQRSIYTGHKHYHGLDYQAINSPDGLVIQIFGPVPSRYNDMYMVGKSRLPEMIKKEFTVHRWQYFVYGDQGYLSSPFLLAGIRDAQGIEKHVNYKWSKTRISSEWSFNRIITLWQMLDCTRMQKTQQRLVAVWYLVSVLLTNCYACMTGDSQASRYFEVKPPSLEEYLRPWDENFRRWREEYRPSEVPIFYDWDQKRPWEVSPCRDRDKQNSGDSSDESESEQDE